jgi:hypothetical protein
MQVDTLGALAWVGLILGYAWWVRNLARMGRRPPAAEATRDGTLSSARRPTRAGKVHRGSLQPAPSPPRACPISSSNARHG